MGARRYPASRAAARGLVVLSLLVLLAPNSLAEVAESITQNTYVADARNDSSLLTALNRASPIREGGRIFHGYTRWHIDWRFWWNAGPAGCSITTVKTSLKVGLTLPALTHANAALTGRFDAYIRALRQHEQGHVAIAQAAARDIDIAIRGLPVMTSCDQLAQAANRAGHARLAAARAEEQRYDRETGHGRTQGAWLER
jgi:predicted secreted Zn-dependent protease